MTDRTTRPPHPLPRNLAAPATRALTNAGYESLDSLAGVPVEQLRELHGMGPKAIRTLQEELTAVGLSLG